MTVNATTALSAPQAADGLNRTWYFPFKVIDEDDIVLHLLDSNEVETLVTFGFSVVGVGSDNGGQATYPLVPAAPLPSGTMVRVGRQVPYEQPDRLGNQGPYLPRIHEGALDRLEMQIQQLAEQLGRSLLTSVFSPPGSVTLPPAAPGHVLMWDANGNLTNSLTDLSNFETSASNAQAAAEIAMAMAASASDAASAAAESAELAESYMAPVLRVGMCAEFDGLVLPARWLWCNGTAVSRETYAELFAVLCPALTYTATSGSPTLTGVTPDYSALGINGAKVEGQGILPATSVTGITASTITLSANATESGTFTGRTVPWGGGDGSTTFNVPDKRGRTGFGRDNMGIASADRLTLGSPIGLYGDLLGSVGGDESEGLTVQSGSGASAGTASKMPPGYISNKIIYSGVG